MFIKNYPSNRNPEDDWAAFKREMWDGLKTLALVIAALVCMMLISCKSVEYVPIHTHSTDTVYQSRTQHDTLWHRDSIYVESYVKNDTAHLNTVKIAYRYIVRDVHDTAYVAKHDTVPVSHTVIEKVEIEKKLNFFMRLLLWMGGFALALIAIIAGSYIFRFIRDWRRLV